MAMVCAQCNRVFQGKERTCPDCGILLLVQQHGVAKVNDLRPLPLDPMSRWQQTPWGRIAISVIIAQGLAYCLRQLITAWMLASGSEGESVNWNTLDGILWLNGIHAVCLILCGMLAGANQVRGMTSGGLVGLLSGLIFLAFHRASHELLLPVVFFTQPFIHMVWGLIGGFIGHRIWKPVPLFNVEDDLGLSGYGMSRPTKHLLRGPIHVVRVLFGAIAALLGAVFAKDILAAIMNSSGGLFSIKSHLVERLIVYQIIALAALVGGSIAGSSSRNGFKQGLCTSILAAVLYLGVQLANPKSILEITLFTTGGLAMMCVVGGLFGSSLFPPLGNVQAKKVIPY